ncbi:hypothetical protein T11_3690 [Trichinella zimbabwensis]|uniref:Uncharacterized protein n=1 Tax=Trichinella zimbabwensis TaxID=268475 RepID=A0A0V1HLG1_9BILA|nr:hypothetical protein T11_3690 [Trichinella zimbabwensis]
MTVRFVQKRIASQRLFYGTTAISLTQMTCTCTPAITRIIMVHGAVFKYICVIWTVKHREWNGKRSYRQWLFLLQYDRNISEITRNQRAEILPRILSTSVKILLKVLKATSRFCHRNSARTTSSVVLSTVEPRAKE